MCEEKEKKKKIPKGLELYNTFDSTTGIITTFKAGFDTNELDKPSVAEFLLKPVKGDPVYAHNKDAFRVLKPPPVRDPIPREGLVAPSVSTRLEYGMPRLGYPGALYTAPHLRGFSKMKRIRDEKAVAKRNLCEYEVIRVPSPTLLDSIKERVEVKSPELSRVKVLPEKPSYLSPDAIFPYPPTADAIKLRSLKSGIVINEEKQREEDDGIDEGPLKRGSKKKKQVQGLEGDADQILDMMSAIEKFYNEEAGEGGGGEPWKIQMEDRSTHMSDSVVLGKTGDLISKASSATSVQEKQMYDDVSWCDIPAISKLVQTIRDSQTVKKKKFYKKGALENHSFTMLKQHTLDDFCYQNISASLHQGDICFLKISRNKQGICMPIAAFCYSFINEPKQFHQKDVDVMLELGNCLYMQSISELHMHKDRKELTVAEVQKFLIIGDRKIKFEILEPEVKGLLRSTDKKIFNISHGLRIFFLRHCGCLLRTDTCSVLIFKPKKKRYYFFDACPRKNNLYQDPNGTAAFALVRRLKAIVSILLDRSSLGNAPFNACEIKIINVMGKDEVEIPPYISEHHTYRMLNERQAVVQATYDLGDICFSFTRNKQALSMCTVALTYSRITAPNNWHRKTLDKIMIIGNQLHLLCSESEGCPEIMIEHLPALFTIGPYIIEIHIFVNRFADFMFKKGLCMFEEDLKAFFEKNTNCIVQIGKSYLSIWKQRDMYFTFDPYTRNKEGLKCRSGTACATMNKDVETLVETVLQNFDNRETIFYLHALKVLRIHRDADLNRLFPPTITLHEISEDVFKRCKLKKSKKKAIEKPMTGDFNHRALKRLLKAGTEPDPSITEIGSNIASILTNMMPAFPIFKQNLGMLSKPRVRDGDDDSVIDLDSPSLSDTQIVPKRPSPQSDDIIQIDDLDSYVLTQEEKELEQSPEGGEEGKILKFKIGGEEGGLETEDQSRFGVAMSQVTSNELYPCYHTKQMNTILTYCYELLPALELPLNTKDDREIIIDEEDQNEEFEKKRRYLDVDDGMQILYGHINALDICEARCPNLVLPYMGIMASAYCLELPLHKWQRRTIDFVIKAGLALYLQYKESFLKIDDFKFELERNNLFATVDVIFNTYIGKELFDTFPGQQVLEQFLLWHIFNKEDCGLVMVPHYISAVFYKRNLFYLFELYNCDKSGNVLAADEPGYSCVLRFKSLQRLISHLVTNLSIRAEANDNSELEFRLLTLAKPKFELTNKLDQALASIGPPYEDDELMRTQSMELKRPNNFVNLPNGTQLIRGHTKVTDFGVDVAERIAPYLCITAAAVAEKYTIRTWSGGIVDFVLNTGYELYKKTNFQFEQLAHLEIPKICLGTTEFSIETNYLIDSPVKVQLLKMAIKKVVADEIDWAIIVTEVYSCAVFQKNGLLYLFDPFPCNELGLEGGKTGTACLSRFKTYFDLAIRIVLNLNARDDPMKADHQRFILTVCRASRLTPELAIQRLDARTAEEFDKEHALLAGQQEGGEDDHIEEVPEDDDVNVIGYQVKNKYDVIEGTNYSIRPPAGLLIDLSDDHFACLVACLMIISKPLLKWDTLTVNRVFDIGKNVYNHADNLEPSKKRTIRNILIGPHFFDVIVRMLTLGPNRNGSPKSFQVGLKEVMRKKKFVIVQFKEGTYVIYLDPEHGYVHIFHPYQCNIKDKNSDEQKTGRAGWFRFSSVQEMVNFLEMNISINRYVFYTFSVINIIKAPKSAIIGYQIQEYIRRKQDKAEMLGTVFHECESWLDLTQNPWAKYADENSGVCILDRGKWYNWNIEYCNDLFSMFGNTHQTNRGLFKSKSRGKQTLANCVMAIGMTGVYDLKEWNPNVLDSILIEGDKFFLRCIADITESNYEIGMEDLLEDCEIFPYTFKLRYQPVIDGTMFLQHPKKFNLYKSLRYFFGDYYYRAGVILASRNDTQVKRVVAFAKRQENEYYMFDCQAQGPPMFSERQGVAYIMRCTTMARLVHVLALTLRGGDFFIYEVIADAFRPIEEEVIEEVEIKKDDEEEEEA